MNPCLITEFHERYNSALILMNKQTKRDFEKDQIVYHRFRGKGIFECYSPENNCAWVKFDHSLSAEKVTLSLLNKDKYD